MHQTPTHVKVFKQTLKVFVLIFLIGCIRQPVSPTQPPVPEPEYISHRITYPGETLGVISLWYAGDSTLWKSFYIPATSGTIRKLKRGDEILIPMDLVVRHEPLPKEFVKAHKQTPSPKEVKTTKRTTSAKVVDLPEPIIQEAIPAELAPLEVEPFEDKPNSPVELEKEFIDRIVR